MGNSKTPRLNGTSLKFNSESPLFKMMGQEDDPAAYWDQVSFQAGAVQLGGLRTPTARWHR